MLPPGAPFSAHSSTTRNWFIAPQLPHKHRPLSFHPTYFLNKQSKDRQHQGATREPGYRPTTTSTCTYNSVTLPSTAHTLRPLACSFPLGTHTAPQLCRSLFPRPRSHSNLTWVTPDWSFCKSLVECFFPDRIFS